MTYLRRFISWF